ncbi:MAG: ABC transporter permease subunit [Dorea sp.]|nr:ABC transporter permease subunit [Dorea sp.]
MTAFLKKEWMEWSRSGRLMVLMLVFVLFGIMNPAIAKLTPWLMETLSDSLADTGLVVSEVTVNAMNSWAQFYKNMPMGLLIFILVCGGCFTAEYDRGTLIPVVTKGLSRRKIVGAKAVALFGAWTALYFLCYGITYGYNACFWDNSIAEHVFLGAACTWMFGVWVISFFILFSAVAKNSAQVLFGTGSAAVGAYVLGMFPRLASFLPARLMEGMALLQGINEAADYSVSMAAAGVMSIVCLALAVWCFDRRRL